MVLSVAGINVKFTGLLDDGFKEAFLGTFARRYLPDVFPSEGDTDIILERFKGGSFRVFSAIYDHNGVDSYKIESSVPSAYGNEAPVFFLLQAVARAGAKKGRFIITDSVSVVLPSGKAVLFVGYPHTGKSTISAIALSSDLPVLSTENTVLEVRQEKLFVVGGTDILVYDPRVEEIYGIEVPYDDVTRSGYRIADIRGDSRRRTLLRRGVEVEMIVVLHAAFNCGQASYAAIRGRKVRKTLWYFATALLKGLDYYEPLPLHMPMSEEISDNLWGFLKATSESYSGRMYEAFGNHRAIFESVVEMSFRK
ncbi:hypothetical protein [Thermococcus gorgonarius]|uniref:Uncharacterized protein n=1 Tax=Thermococcus gorgonarius TaxID=71997 RepID=A0A2Z2M477_THEGO|nr:hypothetical protein [Thermococcus gorgonarius]ASJ00690.1 hypothetical protein A3K92_03965 [Thermococcus gorgonarius]